MNHIKEEQLWSYIAGDLSEKEIAELKAHISECRICEHEFKVIQNIHNELFEMPEETLAEGFSKATALKIKKDLRIEKRYLFWMQFTKIATIMAIAIAITFSLIFVYYYRGLLIFSNDSIFNILLYLLITVPLIFVPFRRRAR